MRRTPMKRSAWLRKTRPPGKEENQDQPSAERSSLAINPIAHPRAVMAYASGMTAAIAKDAPVRSELYRRLVAALPCCHCGIAGLSQAAHPNRGKGAGMKTDDRLCFPLCADRPGVQGCHSRFDQHALYTRAARRLVEEAWGADTRRKIEAARQWPKSLPRY